MREFDTATLTPESTAKLSYTEGLWIYNGLDCCVTLEVAEAIIPQLDNNTRATYEFRKALQGPVLEMDLRGIRVDEDERQATIRRYTKQLILLEAALNDILENGIGLDIGFNWRSPPQLQYLFYTVMKIPPVRFKGKITVNRDALEKLTAYLYAQPIVNHILTMRDIGKKISTLKTKIDSDGRLRTSYNIAGTDTGRFSSSLSAFGTGGNTQNITDELRNVFIADEGMKLGYIDLEQAESRLVGAIIWNLFGDSRYLDACESGDLHTNVCKMCWPDKPWTGDPKKDKAIAEEKFFRMFSFRDMAKRLGHGSNYGGLPPHMAKQTKIPQAVVLEFQNKYFTAFPGIPRWHAHVASELLTTGKLYSLMGMKRWFFGRRDEPATVRAAIAFDPQGSVADILNTGMLHVWRARICQLLMQIHDAIVIQYKQNEENIIIPKVMKLIEIPVELNGGRKLIIPAEAKVGWNWSKFVDQRMVDEAAEKGETKFLNLNGLKTFIEGKPDDRVKQTSLSLLDRVMA